MGDIQYARYRDYRGYLIECTRSWSGQHRFTVWKGGTRIKVLSNALRAEAAIDELIDRMTA